MLGNAFLTKTGTAVGAVDEGVRKTPALRIEKFPETVAADGYVRRYQGGNGFPRPALRDAELTIGPRSHRVGGDLGDTGERRTFLGKIPGKGLDSH